MSGFLIKPFRPRHELGKCKLYFEMNTMESGNASILKKSIISKKDTANVSPL